jgi:hypothetical protein
MDANNIENAYQNAKANGISGFCLLNELEKSYK